MVMIVSNNDVRETIANGLCSDNLVCSTTSRNRNVALYFNNNQFTIFDRNICVATEVTVENAVISFNHYASRMMYC